MSPYMNPIYRPPPKPPNMKIREEKEKKLWDYRSPPQAPLHRKCRWRNDRDP